MSIFFRRYAFQCLYLPLFLIAIVGFSGSSGFAAKGLRITPKPASGIAPLEVKLTCIVDPSTIPPKEYIIDFDDGSGKESFETNKYTHTFTHVYGPGLFKPTFTAIKEGIGTISDSDPVNIVVAKWKFQTGDEVDTSPAIGPDGTLYIGSDANNLYAVDPETGKEIWRFATGDDIRSSPAVGPNGTIYVGSLDNRLYAIKPNGDLKWSFNIEDDVFSSPAIGPDGRIIYIGSTNGNLYALNASGTLKWTFTAGGKIISSPSIGHDGIEHVVYFGSTNRHVYAVAADNGDLKWKFSTDAEVYASPAIGNNGRIYVGECRLEDIDLTHGEEYNFKFYCLNPDGTKYWGYRQGTGFYSSAAIDPNGLIYVGSWDGHFLVLNPNGAHEWSYRPGPPYADINSSPAVGSNGVAYVGSKKEVFYALQPPEEWGEGFIEWEFPTGDDIVYASPTIDAEGTIYFGSRDGCVYAFNQGHNSSMVAAESTWPMFRGNASHTGLTKDITISDIISTDPMKNRTGVNREIKQIKINFSPDIESEQIDIDEFRLRQKKGEAVEGYAFLDFTSYNNVGYRPTAIFERLDDKTPLPYNTTYTASIKYSPKSGDSTAEAAKEYSFSFRTEKEPAESHHGSGGGFGGCFIETMAQ